MLNIAVPMAGRGRRFAEAGYSLPKPLVDVAGRTMIERVIDNVRPRRPHRFVFLCLEEHLGAYPLEKTLRAAAPGCEIVPVPAVTGGAACTLLLAGALIGGPEPLMIANSDQLVDADMEDYLDSMGGAAGLIMTMKARDPKWSYVRFGPDGRVAGVVEKEPVSDEATTGVYNFSSGALFVRAARAMIERGLKVNGEYYLAPVYNEVVREGGEVRVYGVGSDFDGMYGLGTPDDLRRFLAEKAPLKFPSKAS